VAVPARAACALPSQRGRGRGRRHELSRCQHHVRRRGARLRHQSRSKSWPRGLEPRPWWLASSQSLSESRLPPSLSLSSPARHGPLVTYCNSIISDCKVILLDHSHSSRAAASDADRAPTPAGQQQAHEENPSSPSTTVQAQSGAHDPPSPRPEKGPRAQACDPRSMRSKVRELVHATGTFPPQQSDGSTCSNSIMTLQRQRWS
jgi:hypothetical protein